MEEPWVIRNFLIEKNKLSPLQLFILKAISFYGIWYIFIEHTLLPNGTFISSICSILAKATFITLSLTPFGVNNVGNIVNIIGSSGVEIIHTCSGLDLIGLYSGFIISYPGSNNKRIKFILSGILAIILFNLFRLCLLVLTEHLLPLYWNSIHYYSTYVIFYPLIFGLWYYWTILNESHNIFSGKELSAVWFYFYLFTSDVWNQSKPILLKIFFFNL